MGKHANVVSHAVPPKEWILKWSFDQIISSNQAQNIYSVLAQDVFPIKVLLILHAALGCPVGGGKASFLCTAPRESCLMAAGMLLLTVLWAQVSTATCDWCKGRQIGNQNNSRGSSDFGWLGWQFALSIADPVTIIVSALYAFLLSPCYHCLNSTLSTLCQI